MIKISDNELREKVNAAIESVNGFDIWDREYLYLGIRFENKGRQVGDIIEECSKDNDERTDERDFPEYGTPEYDELPELDGISTYNVDEKRWEINLGYGGLYNGDHLYLIGGNDAVDGPDDEELLIQDGEVLAVIL